MVNNRKIKRIHEILLIFFVLPTVAFARVDLIVINADVRTLDKAKPRAEALAVTGNRITAIGTTREIRALADEKTKTIDAQGKVVVPGFNDAHVHFAAMGSQFFSVDLRDAKTPAEVTEKIRFHARFLPKGIWILGSGWNNENWTPKDAPTKELLDAAAPDNPVFLYHASGKTALVNSPALKLARFDRREAERFGAQIRRDGAGDPTGVLTDSAMNAVRRLAPELSTGDKRALLETASNYAAAFGVTSVQDVSADDNAEIYRALLRDGKLKTRVYDCVALSEWAKLAKDGVKKAGGDAFLHRGCVKGAADGDADSTAQLTEQIAAADRAGLQVMVHAVGMRANEQILGIFERVTRENGARDRRFRIEHAHRLAGVDLKRFGNSGVIASLQPFLFSDGAGSGLDPLRSLIANRATLAFGSDASMIPVNPLAGIAAAVNTNDPRQQITVEEAVRAYTEGSAYAEFQETEKGTIAAGKLADFVILSDNIFAVNPSKISRTRVSTTVVDGRVVFEDK